MVRPNVNKIYQAVKTLSDSEQDELRRLLDQRSTPIASAEGMLARLLLARGVISKVHPAPQKDDLARFESWQPVPVEGKPVSETMIEERR